MFLIWNKKSKESYKKPKLSELKHWKWEKKDLGIELCRFCFEGEGTTEPRALWSPFIVQYYYISINYCLFLLTRKKKKNRTFLTLKSGIISTMFSCPLNLSWDFWTWLLTSLMKRIDSMVFNVITIFGSIRLVRVLWTNGISII